MKSWLQTPPSPPFAMSENERNAQRTLDAGIGRGEVRDEVLPAGLHVVQVGVRHMYNAGPASWAPANAITATSVSPQPQLPPRKHTHTLPESSRPRVAFTIDGLLFALQLLFCCIMSPVSTGGSHFIRIFWGLNRNWPSSQVFSKPHGNLCCVILHT